MASCSVAGAMETNGFQNRQHIARSGVWQEACRPNKSHNKPSSGFTLQSHRLTKTESSPAFLELLAIIAFLDRDFTSNPAGSQPDCPHEVFGQINMFAPGLGLKGPSMTCDTDGSSSLTAIHLGGEAVLQKGHGVSNEPLDCLYPQHIRLRRLDSGV